MFRKYEKIYRVNLPDFPALHKRSISDKELKELLSGKVICEEKIDGANTAIIRTRDGFRLQKRDSLVDVSEHEQYNRFKAWCSENYDKIMQIPMGLIVYGEWCYAQHHIYYDRLPDYFLVFDIFSIQSKKFYSLDFRKIFCKNLGFAQVPIIAESVILSKKDISTYVPKQSAYGDRAEGLIIKRYTKEKVFRAKVIWPNFMKEVDESEHWTKYNIRTNKLAEALRDV